MTSKMVKRWVAWEDMTAEERHEHRGALASKYEDYKFMPIMDGDKVAAKEGLISHVLLLRPAFEVVN